MYYNMIKIIAFEGPDCCGKSTQIKLVAKNLGNCMIFRFPPKEVPKYNLLFNNMIKNIYSLKLYRKDLFSTIMRTLSSNIENHSTCQYEWLNNVLPKIYNTASSFLNKNEATRLAQSNLFKHCVMYINGEEIEEKDYEKKSELFMKFNNTKTRQDCYILLDRFMLSSDCYNRYIPLEFLKGLSGLYDLHESDLTSIVNSITSAQIQDHTLTVCEKMWDEISYVNGSNLIFTPARSKILKPFLPPQFYTIVFRSNEYIYRKTLEAKDRELSKYDTNTFIHERASAYYDSLTDSDKSVSKVFKESMNMDNLVTFNFARMCLENKDYMVNNNETEDDIKESITKASVIITNSIETHFSLVNKNLQTMSKNFYESFLSDENIEF